MYCEQREQSGAMILECFGRFEEEDSTHFMQTLESLTGQGLRNIVINLSPVYYLEPTIGKLLLFAQEFLQENGGTVSLVSPLSTVRNELIDGHVSDVIPTFESLYDALHRPHVAYAEQPL